MLAGIEMAALPALAARGENGAPGLDSGLKSVPDHLILLLDAPLTAFGGEVIDAYGVVRDFPGRSTLTGLLANALGYDRAEGARLDRLQARLVMGSARLAEGRRLRDFQTARLGAADRGWTTRGRVEGRGGGHATYDSPHIRYRDADADALVLVALRLEPAGELPTLAEVAAALDRPERPLFVGRKPFLPSRPLLTGTVEAEDVRGALWRAAERCAGGEARFRLHGSRLGPREARNPHGWPLASGGVRGQEGQVRAQWPAGEGDGRRLVDICDERNWVSGVHGGLRRTVEDILPVRAAQAGPSGEGAT